MGPESEISGSLKNGGGRSALNILTCNLTGKRPRGRPRHRLEDNIRMNPKEIDINTRNWVDSA